jgi:hypothetical protein
MTCREIGGGQSVETIDGDDLRTTPSDVPHSEHGIAVCGRNDVALPGQASGVRPGSEAPPCCLRMPVRPLAHAKHVPAIPVQRRPAAGSVLMVGP